MNDSLFSKHEIQHPVEEKRKKNDAKFKNRKVLPNDRPLDKRPNREHQKSVIIIIRHSDKRRDLDNQLSTILDCLVETGKLRDDSIKNVGFVSAIGCKCRKGEEGFEVIIF